MSKTFPMNKRLAFCQRNHHIKFYFAATCGPLRRNFSWRKCKLVQLIFFIPFLNCFLAEIGLVVREVKPHNVWKAIACVIFQNISISR